MVAIMPHLDEQIIQLACMQCPISVTSGLQLGNFCIAGTPFAEQLVKWRIMHNVQMQHATTTTILAIPGTVRTVDSFHVVDTMSTNDVAVSSVHGGMSAASQLLGWGHWRGTMGERKGHVIRVRELSSLRQSRQNGALAYKNFKSMYDGIYQELTRGGIESKLSTTVAFLDKQGKIVDTKEQAFGWSPDKEHDKRP